uniref:Uncharacterized protein n=1 Tax=Fagus sylvatica TaxID=28930 RepID=A0A2N9ET80_FAGSY
MPPAVSLSFSLDTDCNRFGAFGRGGLKNNGAEVDTWLIFSLGTGPTGPMVLHPELAFPRTTPPPRAGPGALCLCSFSAPSLCRPRSGPDEAVGELVVEGGAVGLELGSELVVEGGTVGLELGSELLVDGSAGGLLGLWVRDAYLPLQFWPPLAPSASRRGVYELSPPNPELEDLILFHRAILASTTSSTSRTVHSRLGTATNPKPKIAFLFLTNSDLSFAPLWNKFFNTTNPSLISAACPSASRRLPSLPHAGVSLTPMTLFHWCRLCFPLPLSPPPR